MGPLGYQIADTVISAVKDGLIDGVMPHMFVFPMDPSNTIIGQLFGDEYGIRPTKYIGGIDGDVLLSKTLKCKFII